MPRAVVRTHLEIRQRHPAFAWQTRLSIRGGVIRSRFVGGIWWGHGAPWRRNGCAMAIHGGWRGGKVFNAIISWSRGGQGVLAWDGSTLHNIGDNIVRSKWQGCWKWFLRNVPDLRSLTDNWITVIDDWSRWFTTGNWRVLFLLFISPCLSWTMLR